MWVRIVIWWHWPTSSSSLRTMERRVQPPTHSPPLPFNADLAIDTYVYFFLVRQWKKDKDKENDKDKEKENDKDKDKDRRSTRVHHILLFNGALKSAYYETRLSGKGLLKRFSLFRNITQYTAFSVEKGIEDFIHLCKPGNPFWILQSNFLFLFGYGHIGQYGVT